MSAARFCKRQLLPACCFQLGYLQTLYFICWVNGDYTRKPGHGPQVVPYLVTYEPRELELNHEDVLRYRDLMFSEGAVPAVGPAEG